MCTVLKIKQHSYFVCCCTVFNCWCIFNSIPIRMATTILIKKKKENVHRKHYVLYILLRFQVTLGINLTTL